MQNTGFGLRAAHTQAKQQQRKRLYIFLSILAICLALTYLGYRIGVHQTELIHASMLDDIDSRRDELWAYKKQIDELRQKTEFAIAESKTWQERYAHEIPTGPTKELYEILTKRLEEGLEPERLSFVLRHAQPAPKCLAAPIAKKVPIGIKGHSSPQNIAFFDGDVLLQGEGTFTKNQKGAREFWFDPKNAISITLSHATGKKHVATGKLPFQTLLQVDDKAYHFNFRAGPKGYCFVSANICDYP